jgi:peroxiredoxin
MLMSTSLLLIVTGVVLLALLLYWLFGKAGRPVPAVLRPGRPLPDFRAVDENGDPVRSAELHGTAAVLLFVRGSWCPFCSSQVEDLTVYYKDIIDLGARLILVTPKPLQTTRRVAEFFQVEFDFWLDEDLSVAKQLGLLHESGVPEKHNKEFGEDTVWPTSIVVDRNGIIRYTELSKFIADRPSPKTLLRELRNALGK